MQKENWYFKFKRWGKENWYGDLIYSFLRLVIAGIIIYFIILAIDEISNPYVVTRYDDSGNITSGGSDFFDPNCNVVGINLHGSLYTYIPENTSDLNSDYEDATSVEDVYGILEEVKESPNIKAVVVEVDSYGGLPVAGEEIADYFKTLKIPTVGFIRQTGASAAYWAISGVDKIYASANSDVGSIGVTQSYLQYVEQNKKDGLEYVPLYSGKFKETGSPDKSITQEEKDLLMRDIKIVHQNFINTVAENRNLSIENVTKIADGSTVLGQKAKELGLIDEIGNYLDVKKYLAEKIGEKPNVCWN